MVRMRDVAARAGVSPGAVSRILSGDTALRVSAETRERVVTAARELNYIPNYAAKSLRTSRTRTIALIVPDITSAVFAELTRGVEEEAASRDLAIVLGRAERLDEDRGWLRGLVGEGRIDGAILQPPDGTTPADVEALIVPGTSLVLINSVSDGPVSTIVLDDGAGIAKAVEHLIALGHTRIGFVGSPVGSATGIRRQAGFRAAMHDAGLAVRETWMTDRGYAGEDGREAVRDLLERGPMPSGLVVANLNAALGVLAEIHAHGLRVPSDISIVALHDVWYADATWPPITTVRMPLRRLGTSAVTALSNGSGTVSHATIDSPAPELILRKSTSAPPTR
ncbi:LacI family DNA-binding transcriptional regulator [Diaminobutyricibacter sp. McL0608]|uniref:LacI family DNA-binding transcriptional regulator n=1 Tax=Leifsonia sp. McL0608 TaxID=3143537 RepID=UPI0031F31C5F